jgi:Anti-sigma factor NepR
MKEPKNSAVSAASSAISGSPAPLWAKGLETLYASVVEEPLPASFLELIDTLGRKIDPQSGPSDDQ